MTVEDHKHDNNPQISTVPDPSMALMQLAPWPDLPPFGDEIDRRSELLNPHGPMKFHLPAKDPKADDPLQTQTRWAVSHIAVAAGAHFGPPHTTLRCKPSQKYSYPYF